MSFIKVLYILLALVTLSPFINAPMALLIGIGFSLILGNPFPESVGKISKILLQLSIVGLGFGLNAIDAFEVSKDGFFLTVSTIVLVYLLGFLLKKIIKIDSITALLISTGTAICGGSAIASVSPVIKAKNEQISMAIGVVFILNAVALFLFPFIGNLLHLTQYQFGLWAAIAIHDTSSVVGAAQAFGPESLEIATTVKLSRALWIIPVTLLFSYFFGKSGTTSRVKIPLFIVAFIIAIAIASIWPAGKMIYNPISQFAKQLLVTTLFLIGSSISLTQIKGVGTKSILYALAIWIVVSVFSLLLILKYF